MTKLRPALKMIFSEALEFKVITVMNLDKQNNLKSVFEYTFLSRSEKYKLYYNKCSESCYNDFDFHEEYN